LKSALNCALALKICHEKSIGKDWGIVVVHFPRAVAPSLISMPSLLRLSDTVVKLVFPSVMPELQMVSN
jgi:hypothetical protein